MKKAITLSLTLMLLITLLFTGCGQNPDSQANDTDELETIVFTEPVRGYFWAPAYLAETLGYFKEAGLQADFQTVTGADASAPVFTGDAQFGLRGIEMALTANEAGQDCKILISTTSKYPYQFLGASEEYSTVESLRGQIIAGGLGASSGPYCFAKACLMQAGLDTENDVSMITLKSSAFAAAMQKGELQGMVGTNPWISKKLTDLGAVVLVDGSDDAVIEDLIGSSSYELFMVFTTDEYIQSNPETVQKVVTAMAKAIQWMNTATAEEIVENLKPLFANMDEELLYTAQVDKERKMQNTTGYHTDSGFEAAKQLTQMAGGISNDISADSIYDESFLDKAWEEIGES